MNYKKVLIIILIVIGIFIINNNRVDSRDKNLYYDNFRSTDNVVFNDKFDYNANLEKVGDYYEIVFDLINESNNLYEITELDINDNDEFFSYNLTYANNDKVKIGDKIDKNSIVTLKYRVDYKKLVVDNNYELDTSFNIEYGQYF